MLRDSGHTLAENSSGTGRWPGTRQVALEVRSQSPLQRGHQGEAVLALQTSLQTLGYYNGPLDGRFGAKTEAAIRALQADYGLEVDGQVGPQTQARLTQVTPPPRRFQLQPVTVPQLSVMTLTSTAPPPSPIWLVIMPLIPLIGGLLACLQRAHQSRLRRRR